MVFCSRAFAPFLTHAHTHEVDRPKTLLGLALSVHPSMRAQKVLLPFSTQNTERGSRETERRTDQASVSLLILSLSLSSSSGGRKNLRVTGKRKRERRRKETPQSSTKRKEERKEREREREGKSVGSSTNGFAFSLSHSVVTQSSLPFSLSLSQLLLQYYTHSVHPRSLCRSAAFRFSFDPAVLCCELFPHIYQRG